MNCIDFLTYFDFFQIYPLHPVDDFVVNFSSIYHRKWDAAQLCKFFAKQKIWPRDLLNRMSNKPRS